MSEQEKRMVDMLPLEKYSSNDIYRTYEYSSDQDNTEYFKVSDVENMLKKLSNAQNMTKIAMSFATGKPLQLEDLLK